MEPICTIQITDRDGWQKTIPLEKPLLHIGSDARNDVVLAADRGGGVAARHLQLVAIPGSERRYRAVNLSDQDIAVGGAGSGSLPPRSALQITDGAQLRLGDFELDFQLAVVGAEAGEPKTAHVAAGVAAAATALPATAPPPTVGAVRPTDMQTSDAIGLGLSLPAALDPDWPLEGVVTVSNLGKEPGVQFRLELEGLEPEFYELGSGPVLFPNVEKDVLLRIHHSRDPRLLAGRHKIQVRATAPEAYPGESVIVSQEIEVLPHYSHSTHLTSAK
jgi:hypothetical protein